MMDWYFYDKKTYVAWLVGVVLRVDSLLNSGFFRDFLDVED